MVMGGDSISEVMGLNPSIVYSMDILKVVKIFVFEKTKMRPVVRPIFKNMLKLEWFQLFCFLTNFYPN